MPIEHLPRRLRPLAERVRAFLLTDASVLLILAIECISRGAAYLGDPPAGHPAERFFSLPVWAVIWVGVGVGCAVSATRHEGVPAAGFLALAVGLNLLWAGSLATAGFTAHGSTGWGGSGIYAATALLALWSVWRGSRTEIKVREVPGA